MKKRLISLALVLALMVGICPAAFAAETNGVARVMPSEREMDTVLLQRGFPQLYLEHLSLSAKESLYNKPDLVFEGATISVYDEQTGDFIDYEISNDGISLYGQIPDSDLSLTWAVSRSSTSKDVHVTYSYKWHTSPVFRWDDQIGVAWNPEYFRMVDNSFLKGDYYYSSPGTGEIGTLSESRNFSSSEDSGVVWHAKRPAIWQNNLSFGHGEFLLHPQKTGTFTTTLHGHFVHPTASATIELQVPIFDGGISFSVTGGTGYDELGSQRTYTYR